MDEPVAGIFSVQVQQCPTRGSCWICFPVPPVSRLVGRTESKRVHSLIYQVLPLGVTANVRLLSQFDELRIIHLPSGEKQMLFHGMAVLISGTSRGLEFAAMSS